jgi:hypothetical protein
MHRSLLLALALLFALVAAILPQRTIEDVAARRAAELLDLPIARQGAPTEAAPPSAPLWRALLATSAFERAETGPVLRLGYVAADPSIAFLAARSARELLELPVTIGFETRPLWRALLESRAASRTDAGTTLRLYGVRLQTDAAYFPDIDHHWEARVSLAQGLAELAARDPSVGPFTLEGEINPVHGGANFLVLQEGDTQALEVTFDGDGGKERLRVERTRVPAAPNDAPLRSALVQGLLERAKTDPSLDGLRIEGEESPVPGGATLRFGRIGDGEYLTVTTLGATAVRAQRPWSQPAPMTQVLSPERLFLGGAALLTCCLAFVPRRPRKPAVGNCAPAAPSAGEHVEPEGNAS